MVLLARASCQSSSSSSYAQKGACSKASTSVRLLLLLLLLLLPLQLAQPAAALNPLQITVHWYHTGGCCTCGCAPADTAAHKAVAVSVQCVQCASILQPVAADWLTMMPHLQYAMRQHAHDHPLICMSVCKPDACSLLAAAQPALSSSRAAYSALKHVPCASLMFMLVDMR